VPRCTPSIHFALFGKISSWWLISRGLSDLEYSQSNNPQPKHQPLQPAVNTMEDQYASTVEEKLELITRNLGEVIGDKELRALLEQRDMRVYW
jgi:hypothetical protein